MAATGRPRHTASERDARYRWVAHQIGDHTLCTRCELFGGPPEPTPTGDHLEHRRKLQEAVLALGGEVEDLRDITPTTRRKS